MLPKKFSLEAFLSSLFYRALLDFDVYLVPG